MENPEESEIRAALRGISGRIVTSDLLRKCCVVAENYGKKISENDKGISYDFNDRDTGLWIIYFKGKDSKEERINVNYYFSPVFDASNSEGEFDLPKVRHKNVVLSIGCYYPGEWESDIDWLASDYPDIKEEGNVDRRISDEELRRFEMRFGKFRNL